MRHSNTVVVTSISAPTQALKEYARGCQLGGGSLILIGDDASLADFHLEGCDYYDVSRQKTVDLRIAALAPTASYARKNIGYLLAMRARPPYILESDDDNLPLPAFWDSRCKRVVAPRLANAGWVNIYRYFTTQNVWPRGFPLDLIHAEVPDRSQLPEVETVCPIQQGLADGDPDVDAIYRMVMPGEVQFFDHGQVILAEKSRCPFNSQNTAWWPECYQLMYLPATCSMRMTDIWRSFIAQRIAHLNGWGILFESPTVHQARNAHNLMCDFKMETAGYLHNSELVMRLEKLPLRAGAQHIADNMRACYEELVVAGYLGRGELELVDAWLHDCAAVAQPRAFSASA